MKRDEMHGDELAEAAGDWPVRVPHRQPAPYIPLAEDYDYAGSTEAPGGRTEARTLSAEALAAKRRQDAYDANYQAMLKREREYDCGVHMVCGIGIGFVVCGAVVYAWDQVREFAAPVIALFGGGV